MAYGYDCTSSQSLNSAQGVKCLWLLMHLVSVAELTRGLCLHMWTHPLSTSQCSVSFSGAAGMVLAFRGAARTLRDLYPTRLWLLNSEKMPKPVTRLLMLSRCLCAPGVPPPAWFHPEGSQELLCHENQPYVGTIRIITRKAHSWSEQKHLVALPKKWLIASALSYSLEAHWLQKDVRETLPKCHWPGLARAVFIFFPSCPALQPPKSLDNSSISAFCKWRKKKKRISCWSVSLLLSSTAYILWCIFLVSCFPESQWYTVIRVYVWDLG